MNKYILKQDAITAACKGFCHPGVRCPDEPCREQTKYLRELPSADVVPYSIASDGTLTITVPKGTKRIGRILIEEDGTRYGGLFYPDTGGCFLSSMEGE